MLAVLSALLLAQHASAATYNLATEYSGKTFFDGFGYFGVEKGGKWDEHTNGDVFFLNKEESVANKLTEINAAGNAIIRVDNVHEVVWNDKRSSVRLESKEKFDLGSVWLIDVAHLPTGCSVWPAIWTVGDNWPVNGEIDIIEGINLGTTNQMALHTKDSCTGTGSASSMTGSTGLADCATTTGCTVIDKNTNSFGKGFNTAGGGIWATKFDTDGIFIWFWPRSEVPESIKSNSKSIDPSSWGKPAAAFPSGGCDVASRFGPQQLIIDITLCGDWAGAPAVYNSSTCYTQDARVPQTTCYLGNVIGNGSYYNDAYFEIPSIRAFKTDSPSTTANTTGKSSTSGTPTGGAGGSNPSAPSAAVRSTSLAWSSVVAAAFATVLACASLL